MIHFLFVLLLCNINVYAASSSSSFDASLCHIQDKSAILESEDKRIIDLPKGFIGFTLADGGIGSVGGGFDTQTCTAFASVLVLTNPDEDTEKNTRNLAILHQSLRRRLLTDAVLGIKTKEDAQTVVEDVQGRVVEDVFLSLKEAGVAALDIITETKKLQVEGWVQFFALHGELKRNRNYAVSLERLNDDSADLLWETDLSYESIGLSSQMDESGPGESFKDEIWDAGKSLLDSGRITAQDAAEICLGRFEATEDGDHSYVMVVDIAGKLQPFAQKYVEQKEKRERLQRAQEERELEAKRQEAERLTKEQKEWEEQEQCAKARDAALEGRTEATYDLTDTGRQAPGYFGCLFRMFG